MRGRGGGVGRGWDGGEGWGGVGGEGVHMALYASTTAVILGYETYVNTWFAVIIHFFLMLKYYK